MNASFAKFVDPIFIYVIRLLERIEQHDEPDFQEVKSHIRSHFDRAERDIGNTQEWELAKYAIAAWVDEVLIFSEWEGSQWWENNVLEIDLFSTREASTRFFELAKESAGLSNKDALEVFYVCVVLGFHGVFRFASRDQNDDEKGSHYLEDLKLPRSREAWARQIRASLQLRQGRPPLMMAPQEGNYAPPLESKYFCIAAWLMVMVLSATLFILAWYFLFI